MRDRGEDGGEAEFAITLPVALDVDLAFKPIAQDPYGLVCRHDDPLAAFDELEWEDLALRRLVTVHRGSGNRTALEAGLARAGVTLDWFYEVTRLSSALALVHAGLAPSVLPRLACQGPEARDLIWRPIRGVQIVRTIGMLHRPNVTLSPAASRLASLLAAAWADA